MVCTSPKKQQISQVSRNWLKTYTLQALLKFKLVLVGHPDVQNNRLVVYSEQWILVDFKLIKSGLRYKISPLNVPISFQLSKKFGVSTYTQNGFPAKTILDLKRAWRV